MDIELLRKYIVGSASESEKRLVTEWMGESEDHLREYMAQRKMFDICLWRSDKLNVLEKASRFRLRPHFVNVMKVAATVAVLLLMCWRWLFPSTLEVREQSIYVPAGQRAELTLSDGTKVWLNSRARLAFPSSFKGDFREVELDGEGYFSVIRNESNPFIVKTRKYDVKVLGTEFNVCAYASDSIWEVALLKGKVEILPSGKREKGVCLVPDMKFVYADGKASVSRIKAHDHYRWREGLICFSDVSLEDLFKKLELYFDVDFDIKNTRILGNRYTGKFRTHDGIEHVLNVLKLNNKFVYAKNNETNVITIY